MTAARVAKARQPLVLPQATPRRLTADDGTRLGFGEAFTASMATATWSERSGWGSLDFSERRSLLIDPALVALHYGQVVFEGLKAHRLDDGTVAVFRPDAHARRMQDSARRLAMPEPPVDLFIRAVSGVAALDQEWLPTDGNADLYLRPILIATEPSLALRPARSCLFMVIAFVTRGFFGDALEPITVKIETDFVRAVRGGTGAAKVAGNYAPTLPAQVAAAAEGCQQVVWLDAVERRYVEELGGMNVFFVHTAGTDITISTPPLNGTILPGVTRDTVIQLARDLGYRVEERQMDVARWFHDSRSGSITETFVSGTGAIVTPVGAVVGPDGRWLIGDGGPGPVTLRMKAELRRAWLGRAKHEWLGPVGAPPTMTRHHDNGVSQHGAG